MYQKNAFYWVTFDKNPYIPSMIHRPEGEGWTPDYKTVAQFNDPSHSHPWAVVGFDRAFKTEDFASISSPFTAADSEVPKQVAERLTGIIAHQMSTAEKDIVKILRKSGHLDVRYNEVASGGEVIAGKKLK